MRRFHFPQEKLLTVKRQLRQQMQDQVRAAHQRWLNAQLALEALERDLEEMSRPLENPGASREWLGAAQQLQVRFRHARREVDERSRERSSLAEDLKRVEADLEALESLRQRQWLAHRKVHMQQAYQSLDDMALQKWMRPDESIMEERRHD